MISVPAGALKKPAAMIVVAAMLAIATTPAIAAQIYAGDVDTSYGVYGGLAPTLKNYILVGLGFVAVAIAVVLLMRRGSSSAPAPTTKPLRPVTKHELLAATTRRPR